MAFGYQEPHFVVQQECEMDVGGQRQVLQLRARVVDLSWEKMMQSQPASLRSSTSRYADKYIALQAYEDDGQLLADVLLMYDKGGIDRLMADWARLTSDPQVDIDDLTGWIEKIEDHTAGYGRNGYVTMY